MSQQGNKPVSYNLASIDTVHPLFTGRNAPHKPMHHTRSHTEMNKGCEFTGSVKKDSALIRKANRLNSVNVCVSLLHIMPKLAQPRGDAVRHCW